MGCHLEFHNDHHRVWTEIGFAYNFVYETRRYFILVAISMFSGSINPIRTVIITWLINLAICSHFANGHCRITTKTGIVYILVYETRKKRLDFGGYTHVMLTAYDIITIL